MEKQRLEREISDSKLVTRTNFTFSLPSSSFHADYSDGTSTSYTTETILVETDVSLKFHILYRYKNKTPDEQQNVELPFAEIDQITPVETGGSFNGTFYRAFFQVKPIYRNQHYKTLPGQSAAGLQPIHNAVVETFNAWKKEFPAAVSK